MRTVQGIVTAAKMNKTVTVSVFRRKMHPKYGKTYRVTKKYHAHDEKSEYQVGDEVIIAECRPLSKLKRWRVVGKVSEKKEMKLPDVVSQEDIQEEIKEQRKQEKEEDEQTDEQVEEEPEIVEPSDQPPVNNS